MTAGAPVPQPSLLLQEARVRSVFGHVRGQWDIILIDTPPAMLFDDARRLLPVSDVALLVACAGRTKATAYREVESRLGAVHDSDVVGVLNRCDVHAGGYGTDYAQRYGAYHDDAVPTSASTGAPTRRAAEAIRRGVRLLIRGEA